MSVEKIKRRRIGNLPDTVYAVRRGDYFFLWAYANLATAEALDTLLGDHVPTRETGTFRKTRPILTSYRTPDVRLDAALVAHALK